MARLLHRARVLRCPRCGRDVPEVLGADSQECPHCGEELAPARAQLPEGHRAVADAAGAAAEAFRFARKHYGGALLLWFPTLVVDVATALAVSSFETSHGYPANVGDWTVAQDLTWMGVAVPLFFLTVVLKLALFAPTAGFLLDRTGATPAERSALAATARSPILLLALGFVLALVYLGGTLLLLVGLVVFYNWYQFVPAALAQRRCGLGDAFEASRRFARERRVFGFTALSFFLVLAIFVAQALLGAAGSALLRAVGIQTAWADALVSWVPIWLLTPILAILPAAYWALALRAPAPAAQAAGGDAPDATTPDFRTTKCPQCGTLVPYRATGAPVNVECPVCGRTGRVI